MCCYPLLDHRRLEFPASFRRRAGIAVGVHQGSRRNVADRSVWPILIIVSAPILHLFSRVGKRQEPVRVQAFRPEPAIEGFNERVIRGFAGPREVQCHAMGVCPQVQIPANEFRALVNPDRLRIADGAAHAFQRLHHILAPVMEPRIRRRAEPRESVYHGQNP